MTTGVLAEFEPIYRTMGAHGWSPAEVDAMELWQVASFLGDGAEVEPVVRGTRDGLRLPSDARDDGAPAKRRPLARRLRETGRLLTGKDVT